MKQSTVLRNQGDCVNVIHLSFIYCFNFMFSKRIMYTEWRLGKDWKRTYSIHTLNKLGTFARRNSISIEENISEN